MAITHTDFSDVAEDLPTGLRAVDVGSLVQLGVDVLQRGQEQDHVEPGLQPEPDRDDDDPVRRRIQRRQPRHRLDAEEPQHLVGQTVADTVEDRHLPDQRRHHIGTGGRMKNADRKNAFATRTRFTMTAIARERAKVIGTISTANTVNVINELMKAGSVNMVT